MRRVRHDGQTTRCLQLTGTRCSRPQDPALHATGGSGGTIYTASAVAAAWFKHQPKTGLTVDDQTTRRLSR